MIRFARFRRFAGRHVPVATRAELRVARRRARQYEVAYEELAAAVEGRPARPGAGRQLPSPDAATRMRDKARLAQVEAGFFRLLSRGKSLEAAAAVTVRKLLKAGRAAEASSLADALASQPGIATAGHLAAAVVATHCKLPELAWAEFRCVPPEIWRPHATGEYIDAAYRCDPNQLVVVVRDLIASRPGDIGPEGWFEILKYAFVADQLKLARRAYLLLVERAREQPQAWRAAEAEIAWLRPWMEQAVAEAAPPVPDGHVSFALIDYRQPSRTKTSQNIGDHIQTLASLGHLVRHQNVLFHGDDDLAGFVTELQQRVRLERQLSTPASDVTLFTANRDASNYGAFPEGTWMLAFGWFLHPLFGLRHDFPLHPSLRPIFVSFHCNKRKMLTPAAIEYLRHYGPIGCRDWTTVDLMLSIGVPAFFSGCLTTTVDTVFPVHDRAEPRTPAIAYVDPPPDSVPAGAPIVRHSYPEVKRRTFVANLREAIALLERYQHSYTRVVTSRLHCYLPVRSLGLEVAFRPKNRADIRFNGLIDIDDAAFDAIRVGLLARLEAMTSAILAGKPEDEVYQLWRDLCADDVAVAQARHASADALPPHHSTQPMPLHGRRMLR